MLIRNTMRYLTAQLLSPAAQLVSMILWTHWLAPAEMAVFTLVTVMQEIAYLAALGWFALYALRFLPSGDDVGARKAYLATENAVVLASFGVSIVFGVFTTVTLPGPARAVSMAFAVALFYASKAVNAHYAERARAQSAFVSYTVLQVSGPVFGLLLGWLLLHHTAPSAIVLLLAYSAAQVAGTVVVLPWLGMEWREVRADRAMLRAAAAFGGPVLFLSALGWAAENYIRYLVAWRDGAEALGLMIVGWSLGRRCASVVTMAVTTAAFPLAARLFNEQRRPEALQQLQANAALVTGVLLPATAAMQFLGPGLVTLTVASDYRASTAAMLGLSVFAGALRNLHMHATDQLMVLETRIRMAATINVFEIVTGVLASLAGLVWYGVSGAVIGQALSSLVTLGLSIEWTRRRLDFHWPWEDTGRIVLATLLMMVALDLFDVPPTLTGLIEGTLFGGLVYAAASATLFWERLPLPWRPGR